MLVMRHLLYNMTLISDKTIPNRPYENTGGKVKAPVATGQSEMTPIVGFIRSKKIAHGSLHSAFQVPDGRPPTYLTPGHSSTCQVPDKLVGLSNLP